MIFMAYNYINKSGLQYIWNKIKAKFVAKDGDKVLSDNNFTDALKTKLDGIATGANKTTVDTALSSTSTNPVQNKVVNSALGGKLSTTGTAAAAKKLATARTVQTNLGSATAASFDGTSNITPGITGTLTIAHGGTGATTAASARTNLGITAANIGALPSGGTAASATKLATGRTIRTNLGSTSTATFDGTANVTPGVTGTLPIANGGTGATTAANARSNLGIGSAATKSISSATNTRDAVAYIGTDGVMEIGPYIDLHSNEEGTEDYDVRMGITSSNTTFSKPVNVASGGTGLTASPSMLINLGSTTAANVLQASPRPGITGTLAVAHGGTGATSASAARTKLGAFASSGGTLSGAVTFNAKNNRFSCSGGSWIDGKTATNVPIVFPTAVVKDGSRYDPYMWGQNSDGDVWNFGGGANNTIGFWGFASNRTENSTDWGVTINIESGVLTATKGFSGSLSGNATTATTATKANQLTNSRTIQVNLSSASSASFNGTANITPGITGTLSIAHGGTGCTTIDGLRTAIFNFPEENAFMTYLGQ